MTELRLIDESELTPLPDAVVRFCDSIDKNFAGTAARLRHTAKQLREAAEDMEHRAEQLDLAAPEVSKQLHDWIGFERAANEREKFFAPLFRRG